MRKKILSVVACTPMLLAMSSCERKAPVLSQEVQGAEATPVPVSETASPEPKAIKATYGPWNSSKIGSGGYVLDVFPTRNPQVFYTYSDVGGVYRSDDGARNWRMLHGGFPVLEGVYHVRSLSVDPRDENIVLAGSGFKWAKGRILKTVDGGKTWREVQSEVGFMGNSPTLHHGRLFARNPENPDVILAATELTGVWRSEDNGETWEKIGLPGYLFTDIRFDRVNPDRVWLCALAHKGFLIDGDVDVPAAFFRSDDGGKTWEKLADKSPGETMQDPQDPSVLWAAFGSEGIKRSRDGGASWTAVTDGLEMDPAFPYQWWSHFFYASLGAGPDFILTASLKGKVYRLDAGETVWKEQPPGEVDRTFYGEAWFGKGISDYDGTGTATSSISVNPHDPKHWFRNDWFSMVQTLDGGKSWFMTIEGLETTCITGLLQDPLDPLRVHLAMGDNGYFFSKDGAVRFVRSAQGSSNVKGMAVAQQVPGLLYAIGADTDTHTAWKSNRFFVSEDGGINWKATPMAGLPDRSKHNINSMIVSPTDPNTAWVALSGPVSEQAGGVYETRDRGQSWVQLSDGLPQGAEVFASDFYNSGRELAIDRTGRMIATSQKLQRVFLFDPTTRTWRASDAHFVGKPYSVTGVGVDGTFFVASFEDGVYRTTDGGASWEKVKEANVKHIAADLNRPERIAVGSDQGVWLSLDGGATWEKSDERLPDKSFAYVAFAGDRLVIGTVGSGAFWQDLPKGKNP